MDKLKIYRLSEGFVQYMHSVDSRVQYNKNERRPYVGIVLTVGVHNYFVPMESPKPNHEKIKSNIHIMKLDEGKLGLLGFNNMIPAKTSHLIEFDIDKEPDPQYSQLLKKQFIFINEHQDKVREHANKTYCSVINKKSPFFTRICCDFELLEREYIKYYVKTTAS